VVVKIIVVISPLDILHGFYLSCFGFGFGLFCFVLVWFLLIL